VQNLVAVGAFSTIRRSRRQLLWEAGTLRATTGFPELTPLAGDKRQESFPIPEMNAAEETITDYAFQGFSVSRHIMKLYRKTLGRLGAVTSGGLGRSPVGHRVLTAGYMVCLQMPPTAKGGSRS
jgi:error-prone DNA polymerase